MGKLSIVLLSLAFSSISFANTKCEALLGNVHNNMQAIEEAFESNERVQSIIENVADGKQVSCEDLNSAFKIFDIATTAGAAAAQDLGVAESMKCKINPEADMKGEDIFAATMYFELMHSQLQDAQAAGNCK